MKSLYGHKECFGRKRFKSDQNGIEIRKGERERGQLGSRSNQTKMGLKFWRQEHIRGEVCRSNQTKMGLKYHSVFVAQDLCPGLCSNQTKMGLKFTTPLMTNRQREVFKSDQNGIEICDRWLERGAESSQFKSDQNGIEIGTYKQTGSSGNSSSNQTKMGLK